MKAHDLLSSEYNRNQWVYSLLSKAASLIGSSEGAVYMMLCVTCTDLNSSIKNMIYVIK